MKKRLLNIILFVCFISIVSVTNSISLNSKMIINDCTDTRTTEYCIVDATSITFPDAGLYIPRTGSPINIHIAQQSCRRNDTENRLNTSYLKAGKIINTGVSFSIYNNSKLFCSILSEPIHRLISLGRLII